MNINVQTLKVTEEQFYKVWLKLLQPFLKLRDQELQVLAALLYYRSEIESQVKNKVIVDELLFNTKTRKKIKRDLNIEDYSFNNILSSLRKKKMIVNNSISSKLIPAKPYGDKNFKLLYDIEIKN